MKLAVVGLQGLDPRLAFDDLAAEMPNLNRLADRGLGGSIASTHPPEPVPAWASFATGHGPGQLGLFGERNRDWTRTRQGRQAPYGEGPRASSRELREPPIWRRAAKAGRPVALVGVPQTFPVEPVDGAVVAGSPAPSPAAAYTHPPELADELDGTVDEAFFDADGPGGDREHELERARASLEQRFDAAERLVGNTSWELAFLVADAPRAAQAAAWSTRDPDHSLHEPGSEDAIAAHHRRLDERLGALVDALPDDAAVLVASQAGVQPCTGALRLNAWLRREGYLALTGDPDGAVAFDPELVDWANTTAWATGGSAGRIHLNVEGREPAGTVDPLDVEDVRDELQRDLAGLASDEGVQARALKPREVHEGARVDEGPDLLVYVEDLAYRVDASLGREAVVGGPEPGHEAAPRLEGAFALADREDRYTGTVDDLAMVDGAATVLDLLGLDVPEDLDGRVLQPDGSLA